MRRKWEWVIRENVARTMETGRCAWCGRSGGKEDSLAAARVMEEHVRRHVEIAKELAEIEVLLEGRIEGEEY